MANDYRDRDRDRNRGMFGYEGEGYMGSEGDYDDFARRGYGRDTEPDYNTGFNSGGYGTGSFYGTGGSGRGSYGGGGYQGGDFNRGRDDAHRGGGYMGGDWNSSIRGRDDRDYMTRGYQDLESGTDRGWNIGRGDDREQNGIQRQSHRGRGPKNYQRSDDRIREDVCERLAMDHDVDATDLEVSVTGAVVTLTGSVDERHAKRLAEEIAESVRGVKDVENNIRVSRGTTPIA